jgi:hypothetical protein
MKKILVQYWDVPDGIAMPSQLFRQVMTILDDLRQYNDNHGINEGETCKHCSPDLTCGEILRVSLEKLRAVK